MNAMQKTDQTQRTLPLHLASYTLIVIGLLTSIMLIGISTTNQISRAVQTGSQSLQGEDALEFLQQEGISQQLDLDKVDVESYIQTQKLTSSGGGAGDAFGISVAVSNDTIIVGAGNDTVGANPNQGSAYVFVHDGTTWRQQAHLTASDGATGDHFGWDVALDGETALIGAYSDDVNGFTAQGSVYVFVRNGTTWTQQAQLVAPDGSRLEWFGAAIALRGDTALVGAYLDDLDANKDQGSAYIFVRNGTTWTQQSKLVAADGSEGDLFGISVALSGEIALIGSHHNNIGSVEDQGSAYVFVRNGTTWTQQAQLTASDGAKADYFGEAVALAGETALIGAYGHAINGKDDQGAAYIFTRNGTTWTQQVKLIASNGTKGDFFGSSVALSEEHAIVGASADGIEDRARQGSAYAFIRDGATWTQHALLVGSDGATDDFFGTSVTISGETVVIGAYAHDLLNNPDQGSAFVFIRSPLLWKETKVTTSDSAEQDEFGFSVALSGETALIGVPSDDVGSNKDQGSVYVFVRSGEVWTKQAQLTASDGATLDRFGDSIDLDGDTALIGAIVDDIAGKNEQGSAYVFVRNNTTWTQQAQLLATDGAKGDLFGSSVALHGDTAIIGAQNDSINSNLFQGSAYVFTRNGTTWTQQAQLIASDGAGVDDFGYSVDLDGDTALIGAVADDIAGKNEQGSAYVFTRNGTIWTQQAQLLATDGAASDFFGSAVALHGDTAIIGAQSDDVNSNLAQGSVYVFIRNGTTWTQQAQLNALDGAPSDVFGISLALGADIALIGAMNDRVGVNSNQGSVYVFARNGTAWTQQAQLIASDGARNDLLGTSVAFDGKTALIGVSGDNIGSNVDQGSAYFFEEINQTQSIFLPLVVR